MGRNIEDGKDSKRTEANSVQVKCGEEKPQCARCTRQGIRCPGYVQSLRWVTSNGTVPEITVSRDHQPSSTVIVDPLVAGLDEQRDPSSVTSVPDPCNPDVGNGENAICDNLWDLPGESLPELDNLTALSPSPPSLASQSGASTFATNLTAFDPSCLFSLAAPAIQDSDQDHGDVESFTPKSIVRNYPPPSLRLPPQLDILIPQSLLSNSSSSWTLIEYYFKEVAALFSSYDSQMNPFRTTVSRLWGSSLAMCLTMKSMAAATLVHDFPQFGPMGQKMRREAMDVLNKETTATLDDKSLLALLMLGQTASWHDPKDLGISYFNLLRKHLNTISYGRSTGNCSYTKNYQFFEEALIYWEMLLSFVTNNESLSVNTTAPDTEDSIVLQRMPHPWTGIARDTHSVVQEVGRLVRCERARIRSQRFTSQEDIAQAQRAIDYAQQLEKRLLNMAHPAEAEVISPGDDDTPVWHLLTMAEGYRCTGLMQLYRVFPDLLRNRLAQQSNETTQQPFYSDPIIQEDGFENGFCAFTPPPNNNDEANPTATATNTTTTNNNSNTTTTPRTSPSQDYNTWLTEFALTTISRLRTIPMESRTRCVQPFLLVATCSELRLPRTPHTSSAGSSPAPKTNDSDFESTSTRTVEVFRTRKFVLGRLTSYLHVLPPKPIHVCLQLVREVWRRLDEGQEDVYWMDVMIEKGWETTMG